MEKAKLLSQQNFLLCAWRMQFNSLVNNDRFSQRTGRCVLHETECKKKKKKKIIDSCLLGEEYKLAKKKAFLYLP